MLGSVLMFGPLEPRRELKLGCGLEITGNKSDIVTIQRNKPPPTTVKNINDLLL